MERILSGIAKINFQQNCEDILVENRTENIAAWTLAMEEATSTTTTANTDGDGASGNDLDSGFNTSSKVAFGDDDDDVDSSAITSCGIAERLSQRRNLPRRACKENTMKLKRRSITKPKRHASKTCDFSMLRTTDIKKIYTNQKLTSFRPTNLETIFEEPQPESEQSAAENTAMRFLGLRKIRRSLSCSDGLNINKTLVKQRRAKIKRIFGRRGVCKKISLADFLERLNKSFGHDAEVEFEKIDADASGTQEQDMEAEMGSVSVTEISNICTLYAANSANSEIAIQSRLEPGNVCI